MASWRDKILIRAPLDRVFAFVDSPSELPTWLPNMVEVRNVIGTGVGQQYEYTYKMAGLLLRGQSVVVEHEPNERGLHQIIGTFSAFWEYSVAPHEDATVLSLGAEYKVPIPIVGKMAARVAVAQNARALGLALINAKEAMEFSG